jgi:hypothetical protein
MTNQYPSVKVFLALEKAGIGIIAVRSTMWLGFGVADWSMKRVYTGGGRGAILPTNVGQKTLAMTS